MWTPAFDPKRTFIIADLYVFLRSDAVVDGHYNNGPNWATRDGARSSSACSKDELGTESGRTNEFLCMPISFRRLYCRLA